MATEFAERDQVRDTAALRSGVTHSARPNSTQTAPKKPVATESPQDISHNPMENAVSGLSPLGLSELWRHIAEKLLKIEGRNNFDSWFKYVTLISVQGRQVHLALPTGFIRDFLRDHYSELLQRCFSEALGQSIAIEFHIKPTRSKDAESIASPPIEPIAKPASVTRKNNGKTAAAKPVATEAVLANPDALITPQNIFTPAPLDPRFSFENFITGKPNELAFAAARRVAESPHAVYNPLFLYGGVGLGKTHLMHAIAWEIARRSPQRRVIYLSAEKFMNHFIRAMRFKDTATFKEQFRTVDVLMIDDLQFFGGKESTQEEFFHTFNALIDQNHQIVISADKSPSDLEDMEERLRSRLGCGLVADIHPTTYELRLGILLSKAEQLNVTLPEKVMEFLAHKIVSNVRELEGALNRILAHSTLVGRAITLETTQDVLRDLVRANDRRITIDDIQRKVAEHYNIRLSEMGSARRTRVVARPRQVAMYLSKILTPHSLPDIGRKFGGRDHTTVIHAVRKIEELKAADHSLAEDIDLLTRLLTT